MSKLIQYILLDILKNRIILAYAFFLLLASLVLFSLEENSGKAVLSIMNIVLIISPLVTMVFSTIHYYNSYEFIELILSQPISRKKVLLSEFLAIGLALVCALIIGLGIPILIYSMYIESIWLLLTTIPLTLSCVAIALWVCVNIKDKAKGIGIVLLIWFYFSMIYDGILLMLLFGLSDYPLEKLTLVLVALNPVDLARVSIMLKMDVSALMGYTGALYKEFFSSTAGLLWTFAILILWILVPLFFAVRAFNKKDL